MEYRKIKDEDDHDVASDIESLKGKSHTVASSNIALATGSNERTNWKRNNMCTDYPHEFPIHTHRLVQASWQVETLKCALSLLALTRIWRNDGVTDDNRYTYYYYVFATSIMHKFSIFLNPSIFFSLLDFKCEERLCLFSSLTSFSNRLSEIQWAGFILLCCGCTTAQLNSNSDRVLQTSLPGWIMAIVMALLSGFAGVYTEAIVKKRPSRNINVQNFWLYVFGMAFNAVAIVIQDFDAVANKGFFHGYSFITVLMILNHALSGIAVSMVMKYADNIVKVVYSTSVAMLLTAVISVFLFNFHLSLAFFLGSTIVSVSVYLHSAGKLR
ncbi:unnamed protein product [Brassica oleracea]